jgi:rRNA maturation RNase YbeY
MKTGLIEFFSADTDFDLGQSEIDNYQQWIILAFEKEGKQLGSINIIACSDTYLLDLNQSYLQHDYFTDILTFQYSEEPVEGELFISMDRVRENAKDRDLPFKEELKRVVIHGILHLIGYSDKEKKEKLAMTAKEDAYLSLWNE